MPPPSWRDRRSEVDAGRELPDPRIDVRLSNAAERRAVDVHVAAEEADVVRQVERFSLEFQPVAIEADTLGHGQVETELTRTVKREHRQVAWRPGDRVEEDLTRVRRRVGGVINADAAPSRWIDHRRINPENSSVRKFVDAEEVTDLFDGLRSEGRIADLHGSSGTAGTPRTVDRASS